MFLYSKIDKLIEDSKVSKKGKSIQQMADEMNMSKSTLDKIKGGITIPGVDKLEIIAKYFGVDMNYFFDNKAPESSMVSSPFPEYGKEPDLYKKLYEQQMEITELLKEVERLKNK